MTVGNGTLLKTNKELLGSIGILGYGRFFFPFFFFNVNPLCPQMPGGVAVRRAPQLTLGLQLRLKKKKKHNTLKRFFK